MVETILIRSRVKLKVTKISYSLPIFRLKVHVFIIPRNHYNLPIDKPIAIDFVYVILEIPNEKIQINAIFILFYALSYFSHVNQKQRKNKKCENYSNKVH